MNKIVSKVQFSEKVFKLEVEAPLIAKARRAGHFVIVRVDEKGERVPLTIAGSDVEKGTITLVIQTVGASTSQLCALNEGDYIADVVGPLGKATHIENYGTVLCAGGGVGTAPMLPIIQALKAAGNRVISVIAGRSKDLIILEDEVRKSSDEVIIMTDDGSYGKQGVVTVGMEEVIQREKVDKCFAIGPAIMMKFCCLLTKKYEIPTDVSLNTIMVDGTGMCGACRISVGGKTKFVCVDGPEFDGHLVDFNEMLQRGGAFKAEELEAMEAYQKALNGEAPAQEAAPAKAEEAPVAPLSVDEMDTTTPLAELIDRSAPYREALRKSMKAKERTQIERCQMPELDPVYRATTRVEEVNGAAGDDRGQEMPRLCQPHLYEGLSRKHQHPLFHQEHRAWRVPQRRPCTEEHIGSACRVRTSLPAGEAVRKPVYPPEDERARCGYRQSGALCSRLRARERTYGSARGGREERQEGGCHRFRTKRTQLRR